MNFIIIASILLFSSCSDKSMTADIFKKNTRAFSFEYNVEVGSTDNKSLELWIPYPKSNEVQKISNVRVEADGLKYEVKNEKVHGNKYLYFSSKEGTSVAKNISLKFDVVRSEHSTVNYKDVNPGSYLKSYSTVPTGNAFESIITENDLNSKNIRKIYDFVLNGMHYGKPKSLDPSDTFFAGKNPKTDKEWLPSSIKYGEKKVSKKEVVGFYTSSKKDGSNYTFGNGNSLYACDIGVGNCTDYHSYFMSVGRTLDIPVRFHMGFPIPSGQSGKVGGYHCWADFFVEGEGWTPVDISEADKDPSKEDYYFGTACKNRVEMMVGRDFVLDGYEGGPVNLFIYPILEVDNNQSKNFKKSFNYINL